VRLVEVNGSQTAGGNGEKKMKNFLTSMALTGLVASALIAGPQSAYQNQQERIGQGVKSGQLTPRETANLENKERAVNGEVRADKNANGGSLTAAERARVNAQHQNLSKQIYTDKHNAAKDNFGNSEVGRHEANQQRRIGNGIESGRLNAGKTANLENREAGVKSEIHADRAANGGRLTAGERSAVNKQQNHLSNSIYRDKHN
jgi:hypothetical protein